MKVAKFKYLLLLFPLICILNGCDFFEPDDETDLEIVTYEADTTSVLANPERGFYVHKEWDAEDESPLTESKLNVISTFYETSLVLTAYYFHDYQNKLLSDAWLSLIEENFKVLRENGFKCILRFAYTSDTDEDPWDGTEEMVLNHIEQLKPLLQENEDVIATMQAGFIGVWGEWYYSTYFGYPDADFEKRGVIMDALLEALPSDRMIAVRTPALKMGLLDISTIDYVTTETSYTDEPVARISHHNDCFLATYNDMGTYSDVSTEKKYLEYDTKFLAMGGETCKLSPYSDCENALEELERFHWSYLNISYNTDVISEWKENDCFQEISRRLGYRFRLLDAKFSKEPVLGSDFQVKIELINDGFAAPYNLHSVELIFENTDSGDEIVVDTEEDPRYWFGGETISFSVSVTLDDTFTAGNYNLYLALQDPQETLYGNPLYNIRLANEDIWDEEKGYNKLYELTIQ